MAHGFTVGFIVGFVFAVLGGVLYYYQAYRRLTERYVKSMDEASEAIEEATEFIDGLTTKFKSGEIIVVQNIANYSETEMIDKIVQSIKNA